jgi:N,N-dimethylformamidase
MDIVGYSDRLSVAPGETISFMVSAKVAAYEAAIVRLIHGDPNPAGPGFKEEVVPTAVAGTYGGREQLFFSGSYVRVPDSPALRAADAVGLEAWIYPTTPGQGAQGLITKWDAERGAGYALVLDETGALALWLGDGHGAATHVSTGQPVRAFAWYFVSARFDAARGTVHLRQEPVKRWPLDDSAAEVEELLEISPAETEAPLIMAGWCSSIRAGRGDSRTPSGGFPTQKESGPVIGGHFNGKIDSPRLLLGGAAPEGVIVAAWDFSRDIGSSRVTDTSPNGLHGAAVNMPMRGVTGWNYGGGETDFRRAPGEYGAIFFHDDDLEDAGWEVAFRFTVPDDFRSGVYAARLRAGESEDYVPFFVRPRPGTIAARIAFLAPTYSYLAYANEHYSWRNPGSPVAHNVRDYLQSQDYYALEHRLLSVYDHHADDTGNCYSSRLRPLLNMRPKYNLPLIRGPHQFNADLHLIDWLEAMGYAYDVITDEDLQHEGAGLLAPYDAVLTGTHAEYWTARMLDGLQAYLGAGGRLMYLSGNGLYWPVGIDPHRPHVVEVRRGQNGTGTWRSAPGENHLSTTGEPGGLWRDRGRPPQQLVGVGMAAQGFDVALPYRREAGSFDPRAAFIFEGIPDDALIGDAGLVMGGAAGLEVDRLDERLGTPPHALLLASAKGFSDSYQHVVEEVVTSDSRQGGPVSPFVRADMVYFEGPNGGAVFSVGSITWCGCLSHNGYDNPVSRITGNVLRAFAPEEEPREPRR